MYPKNVSDYFYQTEFFQHHNPASKLLYSLYTFSGAMYYEKYMRPWFKYFLIVTESFSIIFLISNYFVTLWREQTLELPLILITVSTAAFQIGLFSCIAISYSSRKILRRVLDRLNILEQVKHVHPHMNNNDKEYKVYDFVKYLTICYKFLVMFSFLLVWLGKIIFISIVKGIPFQVNPIYDYLYPFPFAKSSRFSDFLLAYHLQLISILLPALHFISSTMLLLSLPIYFNNQLILLKREMRLESQLVFGIFERFYKTPDGFGSSDFQSLQMVKKREMFCKRYSHICVKWIQRYQQLIPTIDMLREYFESILNMNVLSIMVPIIFLAYTARAGSDVSAIYFLYLVEMLVLLLVNCLFGNIFQQMNDGLADEIYRTPWYYLSPEQRKLLLTFLTLTRNFRKIRIFKTYPLTLELFPKILGKLFSYVQIMHNIEKRT